MFESKVIENVFSESDFKKLHEYLKKKEYKPFDLDNDYLYYTEIPSHITYKIISKVNEVTGLNLKNIVTFARLNTGVIDARVRIHADNIVFGRQPRYACVYYFEDNPESGTALLSSPTHGRERLDMKMSVFNEIGDFKVDVFNPEIANSLFFYKATLYHSRWPCISRGTDAKDGRIIIVSFLE